MSRLWIDTELLRAERAATSRRERRERLVVLFVACLGTLALLGLLRDAQEHGGACVEASAGCEVER